jgi:hypothetical protein
MLRDLKISFPDGNIINKLHETCKCPSTLDVDVQDLLIGRKYTVFIENINNTPVITFPESYSFVADDDRKRITFYYQFA